METKQIWKIGDCLELLPEIPDKSIDMVLTDLPYKTTKFKWDLSIDLLCLWEQYTRIIKDNGPILLFGSQPFTSELIMSNSKMFRYELIWDKVAPSGGFMANIMPLKIHESICVFYNTNPTYNPQMTVGVKWHRGGKEGRGNKNGFGIKHKGKSDTSDLKFPKSILTFSNANKNNVVHPTQKPLSLIEYLIKTYTNEGDTVHDSCLGSGVVLKACMNLNRNCIGFEISNKWESHYRK